MNVNLPNIKKDIEKAVANFEKISGGAHPITKKNTLSSKV